MGTLRPVELQPYEAALAVVSVRRVGEDLFETTVADGTVQCLDRSILETFPQGSAKLATLLVRENMQARGKRGSAEPEAARAKQSRHTTGASEHVEARTGGSSQESGAAEHAQTGAARRGGADASSAISAQARVAQVTAAAARQQSTLTQM